MEENNWHKQETYRSLIHYGTNAIKFVFLINSGAIIALLTFIGNLLEKSNYTNSDIKYAFYYFIGGIVSSGIATVFAYLTQLNLYNESSMQTGHVWTLRISMFFVLLGIVLFCLGSICAINSLLIGNCIQSDI
ncbi:MAG: hypothetical protein QG567_1070 [Campylobacterota bacterium]|nr:hypothetical protein [Candidatus Poribacteria bacterium]MDQ1339914.1 hypothetical protein [Campylobacterota bacterium]